MCKNSEDPLTGSAAIEKVRDQVNQIAKRPTAVLLTGETGVGKTFIAKEIHKRSSRKGKDFLILNCAATAENIIESELFGHVRGAFTGADDDREGFFETADGGTLFIDEIGKLSLAMQMKFLRALEEGEITRMGSTVTQKVNVRVIAATNRDLEALVKKEEFMLDLYFRLKVFPIHIPPLRERRDEIRKRAKNFVEQIHEKFEAERKLVGKSTGKAITLTPEALLYLQDEKHPWEGNLRELKNKIESAMVWAKDANELRRRHFRESGTLFQTLLSKMGFTWNDIKDAYREESPKDRGRGPTYREGLDITVSALISGDLECKELAKMKSEDRETRGGYVSRGAINNFVTNFGKRMFPECDKLEPDDFIQKARKIMGVETEKVDESSDNEGGNEPPVS